MTSRHKRGEIDGRQLVALLPQRRLSALGRQIARTFGPALLPVVGALVGSIDKLAEALTGLDDTTQLLATVATLREQLPDDVAASLAELLMSERVEALVISLLDGVTVDGVTIRADDPQTLDEALPGGAFWLPERIALWLCREYQLFPSLGGSPTATERAKPEASPNGSTSASDGVQTP